jgi:hypothetical protein
VSPKTISCIGDPIDLIKKKREKSNSSECGAHNIWDCVVPCGSLPEEECPLIREIAAFLTMCPLIRGIIAFLAIE